MVGSGRPPGGGSGGDVRIGIVGGGAAGLVSGWLLQEDHEVVLFEASGVPGGHAETATVEIGGRRVDVELGAQFFFREGYSGLHALLERLGLPATPVRLSVGLRLESGEAMVVPPFSLREALTLARPAALRRLSHFLRFGWGGEELVKTGDWSVSVQGLLDRLRVPTDVVNQFIVPFVASSWGVTAEAARELSAYSVTRVMGVRPTRLPHTHRIPGGLGAYARGLVTDSPRMTLLLNSPATGLRRLPEGGLEVVAGERRERFDTVILACDWRNSATLCAADPALAEWHRCFSGFEDYDARVAVHREVGLLPADRRMWQAANHELTLREQPRNTVWAGQPIGADLFRTWLRPGEAEPASTSHLRRFKHILMTTGHRARQAELARLQGREGVWAAGMYTDGIDNHESAIRSAVTIGRVLLPTGARQRWLTERVDS